MLATLFVGDFELAFSVPVKQTPDPRMLGEKLFRMSSFQHYHNGGVSANGLWLQQMH